MILKKKCLASNHYKKLEELIWSYNQDFPIPDGISHTRIPFADGQGVMTL